VEDQIQERFSSQATTAKPGREYGHSISIDFWVDANKVEANGQIFCSEYIGCYL